jgi:hypothetical protein
MDESHQGERGGANEENLSNYHPCHHAPQASTEHDEKLRMPDGQLDNGHGDLNAETSDRLVGLRQRKPERKATGIAAVVSSFYYAWSEDGIVRGTLPLLQLNQKEGIDCPGCAWPDPDGKRSHFDFCENGAKAVAHESDRRRVTAEFFASHSVAELSQQSDYWLEQQGRLT